MKRVKHHCARPKTHRRKPAPKKMPNLHEQIQFLTMVVTALIIRQAVYFPMKTTIGMEDRHAAHGRKLHIRDGGGGTFLLEVE